jgi:hypothetical protein
MMWSYFAGLDLGQANDYTALALIERHGDSSTGQCHVCFLKRFPLGTPFEEIVSYVASGYLKRPPGSRLIVDGSGLGRPVVEQLAKVLGDRRGELLAVQITGGRTTNRKPGGWWCVPQSELVRSLSVLLENGRLKIAGSLASAPALVRELRAFRHEFTASANLRWGARSGEHDDLVMAVELAGWGALNFH